MKLTKKVLTNVITKAFNDAAIYAMELNGFVVTASDGWIVRLYKDGSVERIHKIDSLAGKKDRLSKLKIR